jgi:nitrite reductase/ring-hydroxylating ferredoxin subunit
MHDCSDAALLESWFPIAASSEVPMRHVFHAQLLGQDLAVWRADDGFVNVWENRCLHRGVRLTIGINLGSELKCQYHGWRYANRTAACTYIPAHPANAPARIIRNKTFKGFERHGLIWSSIAAADDQLSALPIGDRAPLVLRSLPFMASAPLVAESLMEHRFAPIDNIDAAAEDIQVTVEARDAFTLKARSRAGEYESAVLLFIQPVEQYRSIVHGIVLDDVPQRHHITVLRHHNAAMTRTRAAIEGSGQTALHLQRPATGSGVKYRELVAGKLGYGILS